MRADAACQDGYRVGRRGCMDGGVVCMAMHEGRWLTGGHAEGMQPLLSYQLTRVSRHRLDRQDKEQWPEGAALEDPRLDRKARFEPAVEGYPGCGACMQDADPSLRARSKPYCCYASLHPGPVQPIEGLLEVQEEKDAWLLAMLVEVYGLQMSWGVVANPEAARSRSACCPPHGLAVAQACWR